MNAQTSTSSKTILIVEDERSLRDSLKERLESEGYQVITASDGTNGVTESILNHPDLILLDLFMPNTDGMSMLEKIRSDAWGKSVPVVILTNMGSDQIQKQAISLQVSAFLIKSDVPLEGIIAEVKKHI